MKITKKHITNIAFVVLIGLMIYPPTKVYFIRLVSFSPSEIKVDEQKQLNTAIWNLKGLNTSDVSIKDLNNKVLFVSYWATWCPPCIAEMPSMDALYSDYKEHVTFVFVTNEDWKTVSQFYEKKGYVFPTYNELTPTPEVLYSTSIPATFIIDKNKNIVVEKYGAANWNSSKTREILKTLTK